MQMRRWEAIQKQIAKLEKRHAVHIAGYGEGNERRLTGKHETSSIHDFRCALLHCMLAIATHSAVTAVQHAWRKLTVQEIHSMPGQSKCHPQNYRLPRRHGIVAPHRSDVNFRGEGASKKSGTVTVRLALVLCSWGVANRGCSIRVGRSVPVEKCGYYEDRRPSSNLDPYVVTRLIVETTLLK